MVLPSDFGGGALDSVPERRAPRLSDLKRALRWLRAQYQKRAEEAAATQDHMIERIRKAKGKGPRH
jgi:hypothetical protein